jgi:CHAT domain-containing protein
MNEQAKGKAEKQRRQLAAELVQALGFWKGSLPSQSSENAVMFWAEIMALIAQTQGAQTQVYEFLQSNVGRLDQDLLRALPDLFSRLIQRIDRSLSAAVFFEFANLIQQFPLGSQMLNLELGISAYELALQVYTRDGFPQDWAMTQNNLGIGYKNRIHGERADNLERAIAAYELALQVTTRDASPEKWAETQNNLALAYTDRICGERADNLEQAIAACELALQVTTRDASPEKWAMTQNNLAIAYSNRIRGKRADNLERAITAYELALQVYTRDAFPQQWATTQNNLANAYTDRICGERADNLERAIAASELALQVRTRDAFPQDWARTQNNLANAYIERVCGERADNLERAIAASELALQVATRDAFSEQWATTQNNLAIAYTDRICGERADNLERAIAASELALQVRTRDAFPEKWAATQGNLANAYIERIRGERANNLEQAIATSELALQVATRDAFPEQWATAQGNLANAYLNRIRGERADNLERAISAYQRTLQVYTRDAFPEQWAGMQNNLAIAYTNHIRGQRADNLERAIAACELALQVYTHDAFPEQWAMTQSNLAIAYTDRIRGQRADNLERAIAACELALQVYTRDAFPQQWARTQSSLAIAYSNRIRGEWADNLERAIAAYQLALQTYTHDAFPEQWATMQHNIAIAYSNRIHGERTDNLERAIAAYQLALQVRTPDAFPTECRQTAQYLGIIYCQEKNWAAAMDAYRIAIAAAETLYQSSISYVGKGEELNATGDIPRRLAYAQAQLGDYQAAILTLEQGRARGLSESLNRDGADLSQLQTDVPDLYTDYQDVTQQLRNLESQDRDRMVSTDRDRVPKDFINTMTKLRQTLDQTIAQIRQVSSYENFLMPTQWKDIEIALHPNNPLVYLVTTPNGGMVLIVTVDASQVLWLNDLTEEALEKLLVGVGDFEADCWFGGYFQTATDRQAWYDVIDKTTRQLWDFIMGSLIEQLQEKGIDRITLIPTGYLSLLPLHAAWTPDKTKPTGRRYALDDLHITYAPNAKSLNAAQAIADRVQANSILAIDNPSQDLLNSEREIQTAIASFLPQATILRHHHATTTAVKTALGQAAIAHFSCHGTANLNEPLTSGIAMSDGLLTLKDIFALNLAESGGLRLAILSACETGMIGIENADEAISLPTGLLQAGVAAVIASLWSVDDLSTMILLTRFYDLWRIEGRKMDQALCQSQQWVRDTTNEKKYNYLKDAFQKLVNTQQISAQEVNDLLREFMLRYTFPDGPQGKSFAHPFHWAAFNYTGV